MTYHTPSQPSSQQSKPQKQHKPRLPSNPTPAITEAIRLQPRLLDRVDHQHAQRRADPRDPVDELHMDVGAVARAVREGRGVNEEEESERELSFIHLSYQHVM